MVRGKNILSGIALIFALIAVLPGASGDRSPYVPGPVTYPGLLPQFTSTTVAPPSSAAGGGQQRPTPKPTTITTEAAPSEEVQEGNGLGERFGEESTNNRPGASGISHRPQRPQSQRPQAQRPCDDQGGSGRAPCYDCIVYISRNGPITKFYPSSRDFRED